MELTYDQIVWIVTQQSGVFGKQYNKSLREELFKEYHIGDIIHIGCGYFAEIINVQYFKFAANPNSLVTYQILAKFNLESTVNK